MTDQEVQLFLADLAIIILLARLLGMAAKRLGQAPVIGEVIAGVLLGPTLFHGKITAALFPITLRQPLSALANLGVVMFMFAVGYLLDLRLVQGRERAAASVSVSLIILPLSLGVGQAGGCLPAAGPAHAQRSRGGAGRAAAVLLRHRLDGPEVHLRRVPFRRRHAPGGGRGRPADRFVVRDITEADRAALGTAAGYRILVLIEAPETAAPLVDIGAALAAGRGHSQLILCHLVAYEHDTRSEVATGLGGELARMTRTTGDLRALADRAPARGVSAAVRSRFSQDIAAELPGYVAAARPDTIVLGPGRTSREASDDLDQWVQDLNRSRLIGQR
jgi:hypothetical protein